jgi:hypothetical protein
MLATYDIEVLIDAPRRGRARADRPVFHGPL